MNKCIDFVTKLETKCWYLLISIYALFRPSCSCERYVQLIESHREFGELYSVVYSCPMCKKITKKEQAAL